MKHLWTPWRMTYIQRTDARLEGCIFCVKGDAAERDAEEHVVARAAHVYLALNRYPYTNGHLMVIPYAHVESQEDLEHQALVDLAVTTNRALALLRRAYDAPAFNIGANIGAAAGAGHAEHYHFHIVPRWPGDANFMTPIGDTRVIPDTLANTYERLHGLWSKMIAEEEEKDS
jgi:ATP adenylyltransferase